MKSSEDEQAAAHRYEEAEEAFLAAIREERDRSALTALADEVGAQATAWNAAAYRDLHALTGERRTELERITERTEVLQSLWVDIAGAFHGLAALRDG